MTNNISTDICNHYRVKLPGGLDFRNDCGEAITSCMSTLNRDQLRILSVAESILDDIYVDLCLAENDTEFNALRDKTIRKLIELGEPEVFEAYKKLWDEAAAVIVPLVSEAQIANGVQPYTPDQYKNHGAGTETILS